MKTKRNSFFYMGAVLTILLVVLILMGQFWTPFDPDAMDAAAKKLPPSFPHLLGTDNFGRDIFSRVLRGAGVSVFIALCVNLIGSAAGILVGSLCGYYGGLPDAILTRVCDSITAFPSILLALVVVALTGGGTYNIILVLGILFIPSFARIVRSEFARCREMNYIRAARLMGVSNLRIMVRHILPNTLSVLLSSVTIGFNNAVLSEASMSFLGIGVQPDKPSLGNMLNESRTYLGSAPWYALSVGTVIVLLILGFSLLSEGIQQSGRRQ